MADPHMPDRDILRTTCPRDCYDSCGIVVVRRDGKVRKVLGDPEHPVSRGALCGKCAIAYNGAWRDPAARLTRPLRRNGPKGSGEFEPVSWDEALAGIAQRLHAIVADEAADEASDKAAARGAARVLHAHYTGTCSLIAGDFPSRFFNRLGATEVDPDSICNKAGHVALDTVYGTSTTGFDPKTARDARCILVWGANPSSSAPHAHKHWLPDSNAKVVVVDPVRHATAEAADLHLQLRPGSDAALAFTILHLLERDGLLDLDFIRDHTLGWEEIQPLLAACTLEWGAAATGLPAALIEEAARLYADGPSLLWLGQGLQRQPLGGNIMRACALLPAATGNLGKPGAGITYLNGAGPRNIDGDYIAAPHLREGPERSISHMDLAETLADRTRAAAFFCWNMNVAASAPRQADLKAALGREDLFTVVADLFMTDTAAMADYVLPAASFLEFDDLVVPYFHLTLSAQVKAEAPPGEALPNQEIFRRLAAAMGWTDRELFESDEAIIGELLGRSGLGIDWDRLKRDGTVDPFPEPVIQFADLRFPTPSGRVELASDKAAAEGHPRIPRPLADPPPPDGWVRLLSPASRWLMNDSYANDPTIREKLGPATVTLNPRDAERFGLRAGDPVRIENKLGRLAATLGVSDAVPPDTALTHKGRWPRHEAPGANINLLNPGTKSDMGESSSVHGMLVRIVPEAP